MPSATERLEDPWILPSEITRDLYTPVGDGPGVGLLLVAAVEDLEESASVVEQGVLWSWWATRTG